MDKISLERETIIDTLSKEDESPLKKYQQLFVGSASIIDLIKYELLIFFLASIPGAAGFFLRKVFYKRFFAMVGKGTIIGSGVAFRWPGQITLGENVFIDANAVLDAKGPNSHIDLGNSVLLGRNTILSCASSMIKLGDDVSVGPNCHLRAGLCPLEMGSHVTVGSHSAIVSGNPGYTRLDIPMKNQIGSTDGITVGDDVWIGVGVRITDGAVVGTGSVIGAGAVVLEDIPEYAIAAGVPAKVIGNRKK
jgi:acetyltransferase-like isoleucine patch superfamily enzyme